MQKAGSCCYRRALKHRQFSWKPLQLLKDSQANQCCNRSNHSDKQNQAKQGQDKPGNGKPLWL
ncbi:MAG: hypothetical protein LBO71_01305, partial [Prevotellaceae bacterium]|nr:hypothetical protein [Prevotellaceae bacterium]